MPTRLRVIFTFFYGPFLSNVAVCVDLLHSPHDFLDFLATRHLHFWVFRAKQGVDLGRADDPHLLVSHGPAAADTLRACFGTCLNGPPYFFEPFGLFGLFFFDRSLISDFPRRHTHFFCLFSNRKRPFHKNLSPAGALTHCSVTKL